MDRQKIEEFIRYMPNVEKYERHLNSLNDAWDQIKRLGEITCPQQAKTILPSMSMTQSGFQELQEKLVENLVQESIKKVTLEITSKAQVAVDIVIRNLFERTADVGFLATDDDIRKFLANPSPSEEEVKFIHNRLEEYVKKYSVYDEIIILDTNSIVKANLDQNNPITDKYIKEPLIEKTLHSQEPFTETFRYSELQSGKRNALIYSCKVTETNEAHSPVLGVLCLCFRFENEMEGVFRHLKKEGDRSVITILDANGIVIASSDEDHIPLGRKMETAVNEDFRIIDIRGRDYIAKTTKTKGYQGFTGLGWYGHVVVPCDAAFRQNGSYTLDSIDKNILAGVMHHSRSFSLVLSDIASRAEMINLSLRRVVWNGQVMSKDNDKTIGNSSQLKPLLGQISKTGSKTSKVFADSIRNLNETVISSSLSDVQFLASLAIDIMDRNLYERSNDCRWWALTSDFRRILAQNSIHQEELDRIAQILEYINGLYTVYTNIFVYDKHGVILALSNQGEQHMAGRKLDEDYVYQTLKIQDSQKYSVSDYTSTDLYGDRHTYIYGASITDLDDSKKVLGGIGLVFDSEPQFDAMLRDSLPPKGDTFGIFTDRNKVIISSTDSGHPTGSRLEIDDRFFQLPNGEGMSDIIIYKGYYFAVGCMTSFGYREYKNSNDYVNDVIAFIFVRLGEAIEDLSETGPATGMNVENNTHQTSNDVVELATFYIENKKYGIYASQVEEALGFERLTSLPGASPFVEGTIVFRDHVIPVINLRLVFGLEKKAYNSYTQIIVVNSPDGLMGLLVDDLDEVPEIETDRVEAVPDFIQEDAGYAKAVVKALPDEEHEGNMLVIVDLDKILEVARSAKTA